MMKNGVQVLEVCDTENIASHLRIDFNDVSLSITNGLGQFHRNLNSIFRRDDQKNFNERRAYESVDEKILSEVMSRKTGKKNLFRKGLTTT